MPVLQPHPDLHLLCTRKGESHEWLVYVHAVSGKFILVEPTTGEALATRDSMREVDEDIRRLDNVGLIMRDAMFVEVGMRGDIREIERVAVAPKYRRHVGGEGVLGYVPHADGQTLTLTSERYERMRTHKSPAFVPGSEVTLPVTLGRYTPTEEDGGVELADAHVEVLLPYDATRFADYSGRAERLRAAGRIILEDIAADPSLALHL